MFKLLFDKIKWFSVVVLFVIVKPSFSQNDNSDYLISKKLYTNSDGLPSREITCATQDNFGYIWFGTRNGLCRFDGSKFLVFNSTNSKLHYNNIKSIYFDKNDGIIINFNSNTGVYVGLINELQVINTKTLEIEQFDDYYKNCPFKENQIVNIFLLKNTSDLYFRLSPFNPIVFDSIVNYKTYRLSTNTSFKEVNCSFVKAISVSEKKNSLSLEITKAPNTINYYKSSYLINKQNDVFQNTYLPTSVFNLYNDGYWGVYCSKDKYNKQIYFYINVNDSIIALNEGEKFKNHLISKDFTYCHVLGSDLLIEIDTSNTWRLIRIANTDITLIDSLDSEQIKRAKLLYAFKDNLDNYWLCTTEGIIKIHIEKSNFTKNLTLKEFPQFISHSVRGIITNNNETIISVPDAVVLFKDRKINLIPNSRNFGIIQHYGDVLITGGNSIIQRNVIKNINQLHKFKDLGEVWSIFSVDSNVVIVFGIEQIIKYNLVTKKRSSLINKCNVKPSACYRVVNEKNGNHILVAESGLFILNEKFEIENCYTNNAVNKSLYIPVKHINDVHIDLINPNIYWLATAYDGLFKWERKENKFTHYGLANGFLSEVCYRIEEDNYNNLWVSTDYGIAKFNKNTMTATVYTEKNGIAHDEFNRGSSYVDENGIMYFGGIDGYTTFNPKNFEQTKKEILPLVITKISSFNIETNKEENEISHYWNFKYLKLSENKKNLTINVSLLDYETRQHQYAYQIQGYNNQWQYTNEGIINVNGLPYGNYVLLIKAQDAHGRWLVENMIKIPIEVIRPYNETWWFYSLVALLIILLIALIFFLIYKAKIKSMKRLSDLRLTIASDLHDQVGGLLNKAAIQSELMQTKQKENNETLSKIAMNNRTALSSMRDIIWNLDPRNDNSESLVDRMNDYAQKMLEDDFDYSIDIQSIESVQLNHEIRQNLNMIFKESINNIVKHAPKSKVNIELKIINNMLILIIFNSGNYHQSEKPSGQGLWNMKMRAEKMKGQFNISFDDGVEIRVTVPISH